MPRSKDNASPIYKILTTALISILVTGAVSWFSFGGGVTSAAVEKIHDVRNVRMKTIQELHAEQIRAVLAGLAADAVTVLQQAADFDRRKLVHVGPDLSQTPLYLQWQCCFIFIRTDLAHG